MSNETLHLFLISTELQCLSYLSIVNEESFNKNIVFTSSKKIHNFLKSKRANSNIFEKNRYRILGNIGRIIHFKARLREIKKAIIESNSNKIVYYTARIDTLFSNIVIGYLQHHFTKKNLEVRLITDGVINIVDTEYRQSLSKKLNNHKEKLKPFTSSSFHISDYEGDILGADSSYVKKIYLFNGMPSSYPEYKIATVNFPIKNNNNHKKEKKALIIGQKINNSKRNAGNFISAVTEKIERILENEKITAIDYAPHPRSNNSEFNSENFREISDDYFCSELLIGYKQYTHIFSCSSSVLINSKLIFGDNIHTYSVGLNLFPLLNNELKSQMLDFYKKLNINVVDI